MAENIHYKIVLPLIFKKKRVMNKEIPTLSNKQYESIQLLEYFTEKEVNSNKEAETYPDKLSLFLKSCLQELKNKE